MQREVTREKSYIYIYNYISRDLNPKYINPLQINIFKKETYFQMVKMLRYFTKSILV